MIEATTQPCTACHGTGLIRSDDNLALSILRQIEEEGVRRRSREVLIKCPVGIANFLMNQKREHIANIEARYGMSVRIECDPTLVSPDFAIEKFKTATRVVPDAAPVVTSTIVMDDDDDIVVEETPEDEDDVVQAETSEEERPKKKRRRRRRRRQAHLDPRHACAARRGVGGRPAQAGRRVRPAPGLQLEDAEELPRRGREDP